jgi:glc operon protein GlcG
MIARWDVDLADALVVLAAAEARATALGLAVAVAVVDAAGGLIALHRMDGVQPAGPDVAVAKARASALFRRPTAAFEEVAAQRGKPAVLMLTSAVPHALPVTGGVPIRLPGSGEVAGAVGVSGGSGDQDADVAAAGASALDRVEPVEEVEEGTGGVAATRRRP